MNERKPLNVLFLCNHNTARSIMAEAMLNHMGKGNIKAYSAASHFSEKEHIHPYALKILERTDIDTSTLRSKSWDEFMQADSPHMDIVITMCDETEGEVCPFWQGEPATAHWNYPDPSRFVGTEEEQFNAFSQAVRTLHNQLDLFVNLPLDTLDRLALEYEARLLESKMLESKRFPAEV